MDDFVQTPAGVVPRLKTELTGDDHLGTLITRIGYGRYNYKVAPGLYCVGTPDAKSQVLVTANYKLTFDAVRKELGGLNAWLLVADTRGINVWCAAGKALFSTAEVVLSVNSTRLNDVVDHRELILPQLCATGVAAHEVRKACGFKVHYGPVRAGDLPAYLENGRVADDAMREVTFTLKERAELLPVELFLLWKPLGLFFLVALLVSGFGPGFFSLDAAGERGMIAAGATLLGILTGSTGIPLLLPWLPGREFWIKGLLPGVFAGIGAILIFSHGIGFLEGTAILLWITALSSYLAMNFTGSTPYTSPTGVEYEMRRGIPFQAGAALVAMILWIAAPFTG